MLLHVPNVLNAEQVAEVERRFRGLPEPVTRIVVSHHPFDLPEGADNADLVGRAGMAMDAFAGCGVDVFLSGHLHATHAASTARRFTTAPSYTPQLPPTSTSSSMITGSAPTGSRTPPIWAAALT